MARLTWTGPARQALRDAQRHIALDSPRAAREMVQLITESVSRLSTFPLSGRMVAEYADPTIREVIVRPYRVLYRHLADKDEVQVIAIIHGSRQLPPSFH